MKDNFKNMSSKAVLRGLNNRVTSLTWYYLTFTLVANLR